MLNLLANPLSDYNQPTISLYRALPYHMPYSPQKKKLEAQESAQVKLLV